MTEEPECPPPFALEPGTERHFTMKVGNSEMRFVQRPVSTPAREGDIAFLDGLTEKGNVGREVGIFTNGEWRGGSGGRALRIRPFIWTICAEMEAAANAREIEVVVPRGG